MSSKPKPDMFVPVLRGALTLDEARAAIDDAMANPMKEIQ
jgi:hypothetical protein